MLILAGPLSENEAGKGIVDAYGAVQSQPDGTYGWDPYTVRSGDETTVIYNVTRVENVASLMDVKLEGKLIASMITTPYFWINGSKYKLTDIHLVSGPRVRSKSLTFVELTFIYNVNGIRLVADYDISPALICPWMTVDYDWIFGVFSLLSYYDIDLSGPNNDYVTCSSGSIVWYETSPPLAPDYYIYIRDTQLTPPSYPWLDFRPGWYESDIGEWILRYHGGFTDNPESYNNGEVVYDTNLVIYYNATYENWGGGPGPGARTLGPTIQLHYSGPSYPPQTLWYFHKETNPLDPAYEQLKVDVPCETLGEKVKAPGLAEHVLVGKWVTQPLPSQTIPFGTWTFHLWCYRQTRSYLWVYAKIYKQHDSTQTLLATTNQAVIPFLAYGETDVTASFPETQMAQGDKIIVEVWFYGTPEGRIGPKGCFAYDTTNRNSRIDTTAIYL